MEIEFTNNKQVKSQAPKLLQASHLHLDVRQTFDGSHGFNKD